MSQTTVWRGTMDQQSGQQAMFEVVVAATIGASGAPTQTHGAEFVTLTRTSAGLYNLAFIAGAVYACMYCAPTVNLLAATTGGVLGNMTTDSSTSTSAPGVAVTYYADNTTATDPANGNSISILLKLKLWG
jgi:hypothetical protein